MIWTFHLLGFNSRIFPSALWSLSGLIILQGLGLALLPIFKVKIKRDMASLVLLGFTGVFLIGVLAMLFFLKTPFYPHGDFLMKLNYRLSPLNRIGPLSIASLF